MGHNMKMNFVEQPEFSIKGRQVDPTIEKVYLDSAHEYIVERHSILENPNFEFRITVKRIDKEPIRSWRILQNVKNAIAGEESEAIEVYPKESEVTDIGNLYHLWVYRPGKSTNVQLIPPVLNQGISIG
jgi:hypothetical protein